MTTQAAPLPSGMTAAPAPAQVPRDAVAGVQQYWQILFRVHGPAATYECCHETLTKLPLGRFLKSGAQVVQDGIDFVKLLGTQRCNDNSGG